MMVASFSGSVSIAATATSSSQVFLSRFEPSLSIFKTELKARADNLQFRLSSGATAGGSRQPSISGRVLSSFDQDTRRSLTSPTLQPKCLSLGIAAEPPIRPRVRGESPRAARSSQLTGVFDNGFHAVDPSIGMPAGIFEAAVVSQWLLTQCSTRTEAIFPLSVRCAAGILFLGNSEIADWLRNGRVAH